MIALIQLAGLESFCQNKTLLNGFVKSTSGDGIEDVTVRSNIGKYITKTDSTGYFELTVPSTKISITFSLLGYRSQTLSLDLIGEKDFTLNVTLLNRTTDLDQVNVKDKSKEASNAVTINPDLLKSLPNASGSFESILKTLPGVSTNNEMTSQYSVRGGNFDENLVYLNDIEIYRPLLIRSGQQEGLSFINPELVSSAQFSGGGFAARYGDKLSSVLDVKYLKPDSNHITLAAGLLGLSATAKLLNSAKTNYVLFGARQKTNQNLLSTQDVKGDYKARFYDFQLLDNLTLSKKFEVSVLGGYNSSRFTLIPQDRETQFGTVDQVLRFNVDYEGKELDSYETVFGGLTLAYKPSVNTSYKWINSAFRVAEREAFDIEGNYIFDEIVPGLNNSENTVRANRGFGADFDHARNKLDATIASTELRGLFQTGKSILTSGLKFQFDKINDRLDEYHLTDSAGYTLPYQPDFVLTDVSSASNIVITKRISAFLQDEVTISTGLSLTAGLRGNYNSFSNEYLISPRATLVYEPLNKHTVYRFSAGSYNQPNFYRELRNLNGSLNENAKAQRSLHFLAGADHIFSALGTSLKFTGEAYYKYLTRLIPYEIENLRIRYLADQKSKGYAGGLDLSVSGMFVRDLESVFRLSLMQTKEDIEGDFYVKDGKRIEPGYLKRPTDQRVNFSIFFQDRLLNSPTYKVHLNLLYGSALPTGPPQSERYRDVFTIPAYRRVDIGFSKDFLDSKSKKTPAFFNRYFHSFIAYAEVFNLLDIDNTVSYLWLKDVNNNQFAIPNYLTGRQVNFKLIARLKN